MKNYYAVTVSDQFRSKHYFFKTTIKRNLVVAGLAVAAMITGSIVTNYFQHGSVQALTKTNQDLNLDLVRYDSLNSNLSQIISHHERQIEDISRELVTIESMSGVDTGDIEISLEERVRIIGQFYNVKEAEYSAIGDMVEQIEDVIGLENEEAEESDPDLMERVELAVLSASQERILHDNIPSGFPAVSHKVTSSFGMRKHPLTNVKSFHKGVDIRAKTGEKVFATADGFVRGADYSELSGNRIVVVHNFGFETRYSHLKEMLVKSGDMVHKGDLIGYSGNTGRSSAPHLHYEIRYLGKAIDPRAFLDWEFGTRDIFTQAQEIKWPSLISLINKQITHQTLQLSQLDHRSQVR